MKKVILLLALVCSFVVFGQTNPFRITGKIVSKSDKTPIESATIHLERVKDSTVVSYTISDEKGKFDLEGKTFYKDLRMVVSHVGMKGFQKKIPFKKLKNYKTGTILLEEDNLLDEVVIKSRAPITIKKDTLEFNVKSFKTKKNANVEDLLKKLPGVEVDNDGKITVNGKPVSNILVNGKPFFGNDPTIATKNLSKDIIEKVQVTDTKSKADAFAGKKGDKNNKTINLTIKKENNKGWFGRVAGGVGTDKRYEGATMVNRFNDKQRVSVLAGANNINSIGFSFGEIQKMFGGRTRTITYNSNGSFSVNGRNFGGGNGLVKSRTAGITFADEFKKGFDINSSYFNSNVQSEDAEESNKEHTLTNRHYFTETKSSSKGENDNHNVELSLDIKPDSTLMININPQFIFNKRHNTYDISQSSLNENKTLTNKYSRKSMSDAEAKNFVNNIDFTKKLDGKGSFVKVNLRNKYDVSDTERFNKSSLEIFGNSARNEDRNQFSKEENESKGFRSRIEYRYPIVAKKVFIDASYTYNSDNQTNKESTFDFDPIIKQFSSFNKALSSDFNIRRITKKPTLGINFDYEKWNFGLTTRYANNYLKSEDKLRPHLDVEKTFNNWELSAGGYYEFPSKAYFQLYYDFMVDMPSINQMQPFTDVSNPSNIVVGNPNLKPTKEHSIYLSFNKFDWQKRTGLLFHISGDYYQDAVVRNTAVDENFIRKTTYQNETGNYQLNCGGRYSYEIKLDTISSLKISAGTWLSRSKNISIFNDVINKSITNSISPNIRLTYDWNKIVNIKTRYRVSFSDAKYDVNPQQNRKFTYHSLDIKTRINFLKKLEWLNNVKYNYNPNIIGFDKSYWLWNSTLSYSVFNDKGAITLKAYDLLNQNTNASINVTNNYIEDKRSLVLRQYFMLGFSWKFNTLGAKGNTKGRDFIILD